MAEEVAVFIDLENLRYGLLNNYGQEPDIQALVEKAKKYGRPSVMRAYADFSEHPSDLTRNLQIAGVEAINIPVKRSMAMRGGKSLERIKNAADMVLALDAMTEALEADGNKKSKVFLLVTGDADYVRLVTLLRNRFGQRVIIVGVPGSIAGDLVKAAGEADAIDIKTTPAIDMTALKTHIVAMVKKGPSPLVYWTLKTIDQWCQDYRQAIPGTAKEKRDAIGTLLKEGVFVKQERTLGHSGTIAETVLNITKAKELGYVKD